MEMNKTKCDSCAEMVKHTQTCKGTLHPEHGFCFQDMKFCSGCLNTTGYCDWCAKKKAEMKTTVKTIKAKRIQYIPRGCASGVLIH